MVDQRRSEKVIAGARPPAWSCRNPCVLFSSVSREGSLASFLFSSKKRPPAVCFVGPLVFLFSLYLPLRESQATGMVGGGSGCLGFPLCVSLLSFGDNLVFTHCLHKEMGLLAGSA